MATAREDVAALMGNKQTTIESKPKEEPNPTTSIDTNIITNIKVGDKVKLIPGATYVSGQEIPNWVFNTKLYAREIRSDGSCVISTLASGAVTGVVKLSNLTPYETTVVSKFIPYIVQITTDVLNVRAGAGTSYAINTKVKKNECYTIVGEKDGWGKLKSGAGWISLDYTKKV
jgi:hypothetical protein